MQRYASAERGKNGGRLGVRVPRPAPVGFLAPSPRPFEILGDGLGTARPLLCGIFSPRGVWRRGRDKNETKIKTPGCHPASGPAPFFFPYRPPPCIGGRVMSRRSPPYLRTMFGSGRARHARWQYQRHGGPNRTTDNKPVCTAALAPQRA